MQEGLDLAIKCVGPEHDYVGDLLWQFGALVESQGESKEALDFYRRALTVKEKVCGMDNPYLAGLLKQIGDIELAAGHASEAQSIIERRRDILECGLGTADPHSIHATIDLAETLASCGEDVRAEREFCNARSALESSTTGATPSAERLDDLAYVHSMVASLKANGGDLPGALAEFRKGQSIRERLAAQDPDNGSWQSDLSVSHGRVGRILKEQGNLAGALAEFHKTLAISERLVALDPDNSDWQRGLGVSHIRIGDILTEQGELDRALAEFQTGSNLFANLRDDDAAGSLIDHAAGMARAAKVHDALGEGKAALALDLQIVEIDWTPDAIVGPFRKESIPAIVARLDAVFDHCSPGLQAGVAQRCLAGLESIGFVDLAVWRARVKQAQLI